MEWIVNVYEDKTILDAKWIAELIRCKDCKHFGYLWGEIYCDGFADEMVTIGEDDFCSRGERKT